MEAVVARPQTVRVCNMRRPALLPGLLEDPAVQLAQLRFGEAQRAYVAICREVKGVALGDQGRALDIARAVYQQRAVQLAEAVAAWVTEADSVDVEAGAFEVIQ